MDPGIDDELDPDALIDEGEWDSASTRTWAWTPANDGGIPVQVCTDITKWHTANGPQEKAYDDMVRLDYGFTIAEEHIYNGRRSFGYRAFDTVEDVYKEITSRTLDKRSLYEKIPRNNSARVYFDLEWEYNDPKEYPSAQKPISTVEYFTGFLTWLRGFMNKYYAIDIDPSQLRVSSACSPGIKISFHVLLPWRFPDLESRKQFGRLIIQEQKQISATLPVQLKKKGISTTIPFSERFGLYKGCPDSNVYNLNQTFRMLVCNKRGKSNHLQPINTLADLSFRSWPPREERQFKASLLTGYGESFLNLPELPPIVEAYRSLVVSVVAASTCNKRAAVSDDTPNGGVEPPANHSSITSEIEAGLRELGDTTSRSEKWINESTISYRPTGNNRHTCPMGTEHSNQPFHIKFDRDAYFCICKFGTPAQCLNVPQFICDRSTLAWQVERELYTYQREGDPHKKAAVRPFHDTFAQSEDRHVIVDSSNMGTGKSYAADKYIYWRIEQWKQQHGEYSESQFKCLYIVHRVQLARDIHEKYLHARDFKLYLDDNAEGGSVRDAKRLVICIDSLWKVKFEDWDCVIIDEIPEVLKSICRLKKKHPHSGKWNVWAKFCLVLQNCSRNILLSANADTLVRSTLDDLGFEPDQQKWQQNRKATLGHLTYEIHHFEPKNAKDIGYGKIFELIDQGKKIAIPCAEKGEAIAIYEALIMRCPDKQGIKLEGSMADEEKKEVLTNVKQRVYDFFVYTASMDCGVSIEVTEYDRVVMCLGNRSIDAEVAMQMAARVRSTTDDTITTLCDTRVKDWNRWPGYREKKITEESERTQMLEKGYIVIKEDGINSVAKVKKYLMQTKARCLFYLWYSDHAKAWFSFRRILPPREYSFEEAKGMLLNPMKIDEALKDHTRNSSDTNTDDANLGQILDLADTDMINSTVKNKIRYHTGLVDLMARVLKDDLNRPRNILTDIIRIAKMQEATVTYTYNFDEPPEGALGTKSAMAERKREEEKREIDAIYSAERPTREQFIADTATREQKRLEFAIRTYGEDAITTLQGDIDETSPKATQPTDEPSDESSSHPHRQVVIYQPRRYTNREPI